jgi:hypothetical protein
VCIYGVVSQYFENCDNREICSSRQYSSVDQVRGMMDVILARMGKKRN